MQIDESFSSNYSSENKVLVERYSKTLDFIDGLISPSDKILDLGPVNPLSKLMVEKGFDVENTLEQTDLDLDYEVVKNDKYSVVTAFEILEHLVSPFPLLNSISANKLVISVPLRLWFATAYWNEHDPFDRHYHEFEPRQLDMLLEKAGWTIRKKDQWASGSRKFGIRPFLRRITPRYYIVYCER